MPFTAVVLDEQYSTAQAAPLASSSATNPGPGLLKKSVDGGNRGSITGGALAFATGGNLTDPEYYLTDNAGVGFTRTAGRAVWVEVTPSVNSGDNALIGWTSAVPTAPSFTHGLIMRAASSALSLKEGTAASVVGQGSYSASTSYHFLSVLMTSGFALFVKGGAFTNRTLLWVSGVSNATPLFPAYTAGANAYTSTLVRVIDLTTPFTTDYGFATLNVASPVNNQDYVETADAIRELTVTAPGSLTGETAYIEFNRLDDNNKWRAGFTAAGAFEVDSISGGVVTNRITVAGVITTGATRTIRVISSGSLRDAYSLNGTTWTKRGSQINVSHQNTQTTIRPVITAGYTMSNLRSFARTSSTYDDMDTLTGSAANTTAADTSSASGTVIVTGSSAQTTVADTSTAVGTPIIVGSATNATAADTSTAAGTVIITGSAANTTSADTSTASGTVIIIGSSAVTTAADTSTAVGSPVISYPGTLAISDLAYATVQIDDNAADALYNVRRYNVNTVNQYFASTTIRLRANFAIFGEQTDPDTVTLKVKDPAGAVTTWTYAGNPDIVMRLRVGEFYSNYTPASYGTYTYEWSGLGVRATAYGRFEVLRSPMS